jgi:hypothetical protein
MNSINRRTVLRSAGAAVATAAVGRRLFALAGLRLESTQHDDLGQLAAR